MLPLLAAAPYADRRRTVAGWQIEDVAEQDGGRLVRMRRNAAGYRLQYEAAFWRGNGGRIQATLVEYSDCTNGEELPRDTAAPAGRIRDLLAAHMAECGAAPARIAAALRGSSPPGGSFRPGPRTPTRPSRPRRRRSPITAATDGPIARPCRADRPRL
jgi:hypothetical protein